MKGGLLLNKFLKGAGFYLLLLIIIVTIVEFAGTPTETVKELNFSQVYKYLTEENISEIRFVDSTSVEGTIKDSKETREFDEDKYGEVEFKNVSFKYGGIHICLLFQLRKPDRTISHLYLRKRMGHLRLCLHECPIILHLDPLQM